MMMRLLHRLLVVVHLLTIARLCFGALNPAGSRREISLDGTWELAEGNLKEMPQKFGHRVSVPGLADMAVPAFSGIGSGPKVQNRQIRREAFWYRRTLAVKGDIPKQARLKINKAKYGIRVYVNGRMVGEHYPCFTPAWFDVPKYLKPGGHENEIIVRVGADWRVMPKNFILGLDREKTVHLPGIYDSVKLVLTDGPFIRNIQVAPDIDRKEARVVVDIDKMGKDGKVELAYCVREARSRKVVAKGKVSSSATGENAGVSVDFTIPVKGRRLWSPEDPFLYELDVLSGGDGVSTRFGMRSFRMDSSTGRAILNGKPYFMRGSNICVFRFFEDYERKDLPWREAWVRELHRKIKSMNWNSLRYCIGFPPEKWYDIADELGILIQDEYPIWVMKHQENVTVDSVAAEFREWMEERWNHPCVVIWDAQNETGENCPQVKSRNFTGKALEKARSLDLSNRPWDNGEASPMRHGDTLEAHPYKFTLLRKDEDKKKWASSCDPRDPYSAPFRGKAAGDCTRNPIIVNEYGWVWLHRDGSATRSSAKKVFKALGKDQTAEQRRYLAARALAAKTEYWRSYRQCAAVMHFCVLSCSRILPKGREYSRSTTCDNFIKLDPPTFEPNFEKLVRSAFAPVGLMVDFWDSTVEAGSERVINVVLINDLYEDWKGPVQLRIERNRKSVWKAGKTSVVKALGRTVLKIEVRVAKEPGEYLLIAELKGRGGQTVESIRDLVVE